jgi:hypothetical protein
MCPACITNSMLAAAGATSLGGFGVLLVGWNRWKRTRRNGHGQDARRGRRHVRAGSALRVTPTRVDGAASRRF